MRITQGYHQAAFYGLYYFRLSFVNSMKYNKDINELEKQAVMWWTDELKIKANEISIIPILLQTKDQFISILKLSKSDPYHIFRLVEASDFPANLFLKHLAILADYGGEPLERLNKNFSSVFNCGEDSRLYMYSFFRDKSFKYEFMSLPIKGSLNNKKLKIDGKSLTKSISMNPTIYDTAMVLLYGSNATNACGASLENCQIGTLLGKCNEIDNYISERYIWVSRITRGATANTQGQFIQTEVYNFLRENLDSSYSVKRNVAIELNSDSQPTSFDVLVEKKGKCIGIEDE